MLYCTGILQSKSFLQWGLECEGRRGTYFGSSSARADSVLSFAPGDQRARPWPRYRPSWCREMLIIEEVEAGELGL
jgi:hypothetical protein